MKRALPLNYEDAARVIIPYGKYKGRLLAEVAAADLSFVKEICEACPVPVYAIGGIRETNLGDVMAAGAAGGCMMSGYMRI